MAEMEKLVAQLPPASATKGPASPTGTPSTAGDSGRTRSQYSLIGLFSGIGYTGRMSLETSEVGI